MSLIKTISPENATGEIAEIYDSLKKMFSMVPNALRISSTSPHRLKAQFQELAYYGNHPTLKREVTTAIRYVVAVDHGCDYCVTINGMMLKGAGWSDTTIKDLPVHPENAPFDTKDSALFAAVIKAVRKPKDLVKDDMDKLHDLGWQDGDILDAVGHGALSVATDMILRAFKVDPDGK